MGAPVLFNELKKKQRRCEALPSILPFFRNEFKNFNNIYGGIFKTEHIRKIL